jgi:hypothetical protein
MKKMNPKCIAAKEITPTRGNLIYKRKEENL